MQAAQKMTKAEAQALLREARAAGFEAAIGCLGRGRWYLSCRHKTETHWGFTVLSRDQWARIVEQRGG
jgi:hypothetical protein